MTSALSRSTHTATPDDSARESIFDSIRRSLAESALIDERRAKRYPARTEKTLPEHYPPSRETLVENFRSNLETVGVHFQIVSNESGVTENVLAAIEKLGANKAAISDSPLVEAVTKNISGVEIVRSADREYLFGSDVGITSAQWAIAETGTLVLESRDERHRLISLVPPVHICILEADRIRQTLGEILETIQEDLSRTVTFITGASRTSDIELTLAIGVHGPRDLHVILIDRQA